MKMGFYVVVDGLSGSGKGTQVYNIARYLQEKDADSSVILTREPDNSPMGRSIRELRKLHKAQGVDTSKHAREYSERYVECGIDNSRNLVVPNLLQGVHVVKDRMTAITQLAYQRREGLPLEYLRTIWENEEIRKPDLALILTVPPEIALERIDKSGRKRSALETPEIMEKLNHYFCEIPMMLGEDRVKRVIAYNSIEDVFNEIKIHIDARWAQKYG